MMYNTAKDIPDFEFEDEKEDIMTILNNTFCEGESVISGRLFKVILEFLKANT